MINLGPGSCSSSRAFFGAGCWPFEESSSNDCASVTESWTNVSGKRERLSSGKAHLRGMAISRVNPWVQAMEVEVRLRNRSMLQFVTVKGK